MYIKPPPPSPATRRHPRLHCSFANNSIQIIDLTLVWVAKQPNDGS